MNIKKSQIKTTHIPLISKPEYYSAFENRKPPRPILKTKKQFKLFRILSILYVFCTIPYLIFRFKSLYFSINQIWYILFFLAETMVLLGSYLRIFNLWGYIDAKPTRPVKLLSEIKTLNEEDIDRPISIALFIATHNENEFLLKKTIESCYNLDYPYKDVTINCYLLDDGNRPELAILCSKYNVNYLSKHNNIGYKAGNLNNAFHQTNEDLIVILDADTFLFENFLVHTTGYFKDHKMGWVQTPQWYFDLSDGLLPSEYFGVLFGTLGRKIGKGIDFITFKKLYFNHDIYASNSDFFYDNILRCKNYLNAVFSCGAGSIFRRDMLNIITHSDQTITSPFVTHISEDVSTSILLHSITDYKSIYHHHYESKMLSPQSTESWIKQQTRYASGAIDIGINQSPIFNKTLSFKQKWSYFSIFFFYITPLFNPIFFLSPILYLNFGISSFPKFNTFFLIQFCIIYFLNLLIFTISNKGISTKRPDQKFWSSYTYVFSSWLKVFLKVQLKFNTTSKSISPSNGFKYIWSHLFILILMVVSPIISLSTTTKPNNIEFYFYLFWCIYFMFQLNQIIRMWLWDLRRIDAS